MSEEESFSSEEESGDEEISSYSLRESTSVRKSMPSRNVTIEDSEEEEDAEETMDRSIETSAGGRSENAENSDDSIIIPKNRRNKLVLVSDSEDEEEEEVLERMALSPRARMSITGIRPADLSDDSSEIEYSDEEKATNSLKEMSNEEDEDESSQNYESANAEESSSSPDSRKNSLLEESAVESSTKNSSALKSENSENEKESSRLGVSMDQNFNSPMNLPRYSSHFAKAIQEKLSSTIYQPRNETNNNESSTDSDILIVSNQREETIELFSSDDDVQAVPVAPKPATPKQQKPLVSGNFVQPKINLVKPKASGTPKVKKNYVSNDFYKKEVLKLDEMKLELQNAEKLVEKIAHNLPDKGRQLQLRCERLRNDIMIKNNYVASLEIEDLPGSSKFPGSNQEKAKPFFNKAAPDWDELSNAVNEIKPIHTGARGLQTFNTQKALTVERLKEMHSSLEKRPTEDVFAEDPKGLKVTLMPHQKHALAWMAWREKQKPRGGILADDMGLGKTLTMISMVLAAKNREDEEEEDDGKKESDSEDEETKENHGWTSKGRRDLYNGGTLVVCPASLIRQWESEVNSKLSRHKLSVCVHHGNNREVKPKHLRTYDMVVTTYNIVSREHKVNGAIFGLKWRRIILDEAHIVRNHKAQSSMGVCALKGRYRWALTGTPIQNKESDVYALMKFLRCSPFDDLGHWKKWIDNKSAGGQMRLNTLMQSLMLRRTKAQLQTKGELTCLPEKETKLIEVNLDKDEMNVYQKIMIFSRTLFAQFLMQRAERNTDLYYQDSASRPTYLQKKDPNDAYFKMHQKFTRLHHGDKQQVKSHEILVLLLRLRQICCHPGLIDAMLEDDDSHHFESDNDASQPEIDLLEQLNKLAIKDTSTGSNNSAMNSMEEDESLHPEDRNMAKASAKVLQKSNPVFNLARPSSKMLKVLKTLQNNVLASNDKAIIVSQWTSVLNILRNHLEERGVQTLALNGTIPVKNRQEIVDEFNNPQSNKRILLLSLTAGGVGLNLVGANHLLMIDLHWNPQLEAQAQDRIYRVGQKKNVIIYKFMCKDTVEERIKALQDQKLAIANGVLTGVKGSEGSKLSIDDLKGLFGM